MSKLYNDSAREFVKTLVVGDMYHIDVVHSLFTGGSAKTSDVFEFYRLIEKPLNPHHYVGYLNDCKYSRFDYCIIFKDESGENITIELKDSTNVTGPNESETYSFNYGGNKISIKKCAKWYDKIDISHPALFMLSCFIRSQGFDMGEYYKYLSDKFKSDDVYEINDILSRFDYIDNSFFEGKYGAAHYDWISGMSNLKDRFYEN